MGDREISVVRLATAVPLLQFPINGVTTVAGTKTNCPPTGGTMSVAKLVLPVAAVAEILLPVFRNVTEELLTKLEGRL